MGFGRPTGPPASRQQMDELVELLERAGHADFRDARGPMGFNQRQAGGRFTRDEAQAFIDELIAAEDARLEAAPPALRVVEARAEDDDAVPVPENAFPDASDEELARELRRRGFTVTRAG